MILNRNKYKEKKEQEKEFKELLEPIYVELFKFIFSLSKNKILTDDALQNTLVKAYENFYQLKEKEKFKSWIFSIGKNEVLDMFRKYNRRLEDFLEEDILHKLCITGSTTEEIFIKDETKDRIINEIKKLKSIYKKIIILYYYHELSLDEIAIILQINASTIRTRHARAKKHLYERLKDLDREMFIKEGVKQ